MKWKEFGSYHKKMVYFTVTDKGHFTEVYFWVIIWRNYTMIVKSSANASNTQNLINFLTDICNSFTFLKKKLLYYYTNK